MLMARLHAPTRARSCWTAATPAPSASPTTPGAWPLRQSPGFNLRLTVDELVAFGRFPYSRGALTAQDRHAIDEAIAFWTWPRASPT